MLSHCFAPGGLDHAVTLENRKNGFLVRYPIDPAVFSHVISIVTPYSVLLIGFLPGDGVEIVAQISLPEAVDPDRTSAFLDGGQLALTIAKVAGHGVPA